jgi:hypothetical protein
MTCGGRVAGWMELRMGVVRTCEEDGVVRRMGVVRTCEGGVVVRMGL